MKKISDGNLSDIPTIMDIIQPLNILAHWQKGWPPLGEIEDTYSAYAINGEYGD